MCLENIVRDGGGVACPLVSVSGVAEVLGLGVSQTPEGDDELTGGLTAQAVGALAERTIHVVMSHGDHVFSDGEKANREDLTGGRERRALHELRSFDSLNIQVSEGNGANGGQLVNWLPDPGGALKKPPCGGGVSVEAHP